MGVLITSFFSDNERLQKCSVDHRYCVKVGDRGKHVGRLQLFMQAWVNVAMKPLLWPNGDPNDPAYDYYDSDDLNPQAKMALDCVPFLIWEEYNPWFGEMIHLYKEYYSVIDKKRQSAADNIVGILTIRHMDNNGRRMPRPALDRSNEAYLKASSPSMKIAAAVSPRRALRLAKGC